MNDEHIKLELLLRHVEGATMSEDKPTTGWRCGKCDGGGFPLHSPRCPLRTEPVEADVERLTKELAETEKGLALIGELLQTGGMTDAHFLAGQIEALLENDKDLEQRSFHAGFQRGLAEGKRR